MNKQEQIYNWLTTGLQQSADRLSEIFYYDKRNNEFFSILVTDYLMFDENLNIAKDTTTTYSKENLETLIERIRRIESKDVSIISLPRLGILAHIDDKTIIYQEIDSFLNLNSINLETVKIWEVDENVSITIDINDKDKQMNKRSWWKVWQ